MSAFYLAADPIEAQIVRDYLADAGIAVRVDGVQLWSARGDLPLEYPRLYLLDARDEPRARALIREYERRAHNPSQWRCDCGASVPAYFELCWNCAASRPGAQG